MSSSRVRPRRRGGSRTAGMAMVGLAVAIVAPAIVLSAPQRDLDLAAALAFVLLGFGPTVTAWLDTGDAFAQLALTVALSLAGYAITAALLIWAQAWHPRVLLILAIPTIVSCLSRLAQGGTDLVTLDVD